MNNSTQRFSNRVENYVKYRPGYPPQLLPFFQAEMNLKTDSVIADIGSGTGISSKLFLENGNPVLGVEPNEAMREAAQVFLQDFPRFQAVAGTAEKTNLREKSIDIIVAAQAFHWFERQEAQEEFRRILKDKGFVALIWNERKTASGKFLLEYENFIREFGNDYKEVRHDNLSRQTLADFFPSPFQMTTFSNSQTLDLPGLKGRTLSSSYMPDENNSRFAEMEKALERLFTQYQKNDTIEILYDTRIYYGQF